MSLFILPLIVSLELNQKTNIKAKTKQKQNKIEKKTLLRVMKESNLTIKINLLQKPTVIIILQIL